MTSHDNSLRSPIIETLSLKLLLTLSERIILLNCSSMNLRLSQRLMLAIWIAIRLSLTLSISSIDRSSYSYSLRELLRWWCFRMIKGATNSKVWTWVYLFTLWRVHVEISYRPLFLCWSLSIDRRWKDLSNWWLRRLIKKPLLVSIQTLWLSQLLWVMPSYPWWIYISTILAHSLSWLRY